MSWSTGLWQTFFASCVGTTVSALSELRLWACGCKKFTIDTLGDHVITCTTHSGVKKTRDWSVDQLADLFRTTHKVKTQQVTRSRGQRCGDIELTGYLANAVGPVPWVLDLHIAHDRFGSSSDPSINGHLHYPNDIDRSLNETATDKIRKYRADYTNNPPNAGRLHSEFVCLLFLQDHRETDRFFVTSGVQLAQSDRGQFHYKRVVFSLQLKSNFGNILAKDVTLRIILNIDGAPVTSRSHTHQSTSQTVGFRLLTSSLYLGVPVPCVTQCMWDV